MRPSLLLRASHARTPSIKFLGKRKHPQNVDHTPQPHPASPTHKLPDSFASYRQRATQHGPMGSGSDSANGSPAARPSGSRASSPTSLSYGAIGGTAGRNLGPVKPAEGEFFDISELPRRFQRRPWSDAEIDAITSGGASMW